MSATAMGQEESRRSLDMPHLETFWRRVTRREDGNRTPASWSSDRIVIEGLGLPLEETLQYLGQRQPTLDEFERWILERNDGYIEPLRIERINATIDGRQYSDELKAEIQAIDESEPVFTAADLSFWKEHGYVILHKAIS